MSVKIYVGNLAYQTTSEDLQALFSQSGQVDSAAVVQDRDTSVVWGMPGAVAQAGLASAMLPPFQIADLLSRRDRVAA